GGVIAPRLAVVIDQLAAGAVVDMAGREHRQVGADADQGLHLRGDTETPFTIMAPVQRAHPDRIPCDQMAAGCAIPEGEGEDAVEARNAGRAALAIKRIDDFAVGTGLKGVLLRQSLLEFAVVVDFAVYGEHQFAIGGTGGWRSAGRVDDGEALMHEHGSVVDTLAAPVRPARRLALGKLPREPSQVGQIVAALHTDDAEYRTHGRHSF